MANKKWALLYPVFILILGMLSGDLFIFGFYLYLFGNIIFLIVFDTYVSEEDVYNTNIVWIFVTFVLSLIILRFNQDYYTLVAPPDVTLLILNLIPLIFASGLWLFRCVTFKSKKLFLSFILTFTFSSVILLVAYTYTNMIKATVMGTAYIPQTIIQKNYNFTK